MFYKKNVDFVKLLWEDFTFQIKNRCHKKQEKMYYPRFTKAIIHHFITQYKLILMRNRIFMHTAQDDSILAIQDSTAYKIYLAYATGAASPNMKRKFKKPAYPLKKRTLVTIGEEEPEHAKKCIPSKKPVAKRQFDGVRIKDTLGSSIEKALKRSKRETNIHQVGGSSEGTDFESKGDGVDETDVQDDEDVQDSDDEPQHEECERINEELYGDVNVNLTDDEPADKEKDDDEMTVVGHMNVNQEGAGNQVKDDDQETQNTEGPLPSSSISFDYAAKFLNFDNIPPVNTKVIFMMDINVQHEVPLKEHSVLAKIVERLGQKYAPQKSIEDIQEIKIEHARKHQVPKETITSFDTIALKEFDQKNTLFETMTKYKSFNKSSKQRAIYHAIMNSILEDEDTMDEGVADKFKKRKSDDADKDEGPFVGSDRGLKRRKTSKETETSKKAKSTESSKGTSTS
nr:hypothetical protein [Tanacetum cinerariifolium]